jgi:hypothetical protein
VILIALIGVTFATPSMADNPLINPAQGLAKAAEGVVIGIAVVGAVLAVGITLLVLHEKRKTSAITGCITSGVGGMSVKDDKDKRVYTLSGDPAGVKPGDRMTMEGKHRGGKMPVFEVRSVTRDLGACQP